MTCTPSAKHLRPIQAEALAAAHPNLIEYHRVEEAKHIRTCNIDPKKYDAQLEAFIEKVLPGLKRE